ncbi:MAG: porin family protein [Bacteroidota bacterium]|nr:porin family protein [Bacteroidota bacterium]
MKKIILLSVFIAAFGLISKAQIQFGMKAGITSSSIKTDEVYADLNNDDYDKLKVKGGDAKLGFQGGVFARVTIAALYVQPELLFSSTSGDVEVSRFDGETLVGGSAIIKEQEFKKIDIPIMLGWKFGPARVQAGPIASFILDSDMEEISAYTFKQEFNGATWGYQVGVGLDILNTLTLDLKYEGNLSKLGDGVEFAGENRSFDSRNSQLIATVGIFF